MTTLDLPMARVKRKTGKEQQPAGEPTALTIGVRASKEWAEWLDALAEHYRTTRTGIIDRALAEWAEAEGYPVKPPVR